MQDSGNCPKCGSQRLVKGDRIFGRFSDGTKHDLYVEVYEEPDALIFKKAHEGALEARICGDCGLTELYVNNPDELWSASSNKG